MDPLSGAANLIVGLIRTHKLNEWAKLCFGMAFSYAAAFSFTTGSVLVARQAALVAIGSGMVAGACAMLFLFVRSPLTKNIMVAVPRELTLEAEERQELVSIRK
jgi:uncharacterized membrane protein YagU involved in acid resistance